MELQTVLVPLLGSLPLGFASVETELRRLRNLTWYGFYSDFPYWPMYMNGQGATARKLEERYRRTTEGGGPRRPVYDASGLQAVPINVASRNYHMPQHFLTDRRPEFLKCLRARGLPAQPAEPAAADPNKRFTKWPKERKPTLAMLERDLAVLKRPGEVMGAPVYSIGNDFKDYFNQLAIAIPDLHKLGIVFLAKEGDTDGIPPGSLIYISEKRLGFGIHGASNVAQRFSDAFLDLFREDMDDAEDEHLRQANGGERAWLQRRLDFQRRRGEPCVPIRRFSLPVESLLPDISAPPRLDLLPPGYVCPQLRLYSALMFTDDPQYISVGVERTKRAIRVAARLIESIGLITAIPAKRSLGAWSTWLGVYVIAALRLIIVPPDKIIRASSAIREALACRLPFGVYRSLCGLLEHLRAVNLAPRNVMFGMYRPHGPHRRSRDKDLRRWSSATSS